MNQGQEKCEVTTCFSFIAVDVMQTVVSSLMRGRNQKNVESSICTLLPREILRKIIERVPASYRFVASVNEEFRDLYLEADEGKCKTYKYAISSIPALKIYLKERKDDLWLSDEKAASIVGAGAGQINLIKWAGLWDRHTFDNAVKRGHIHILVWLRKQGCEWHTAACAEAAARGHLKMLVWLHDQGCPCGSITCANLARGGHLRTLKWLKEKGCVWDEETCAKAAEGGNLKLLIWAREQGCPWNSETCSRAAKGGHFEILKWAREHGCDWNEVTCYWAARNGHLDILKWAMHNECPYYTHLTRFMTHQRVKEWFATFEREHSIA